MMLPPTTATNNLLGKEDPLGRFDGSLKLPGETGPGLSVQIDLTDDTIAVRSTAGDIGAWPRSQVRINALEDGFHLRAEGEEVILDVSDDARFALACGLTAGPPLLRRKMSAILREQG
jgi:hypothetical protein